jgi:hypothetical protein
VLLVCDLKLEVHAFPKQKLLNLSRRCEREAVDEPHVPRYFIMSYTTAAKLSEFLFGHHCVGFETDTGADLLAVFAIRHADDRDLKNGGMLI